MTDTVPIVQPVPTSDGLLEQSRQYQLMAIPMFVMTTFPAETGMAPVQEAVPGHLEYWAKLEEDGVMFAGGPVMSEPGSDPWSGEGLIIFRAESLAAAHTIAGDDPMHASGARRYELRRWLLNHLVVPDEAKP
jgi:hypothetical protein